MRETLFLFCLFALAGAAGAQPEVKAPLRAFQTEDNITLTTLESNHFSPDRKRWVTLTRRGDLASNTNLYTVYLFECHDPTPQLLLELASSTARPAIEELRWMPDNRTLVFVGEEPGKLRQLYALDSKTRKLRRPVKAKRHLVAGDVSGDLKSVAYVPGPRPRRLFEGERARNGAVIGGQGLTRILADPDQESLYSEDLELVLNGRPVEIPDSLFPRGGLQFSPDGKYLLVDTRVREVSSLWKDYQDSIMQAKIAAKPPKGRATDIWMFYLVEVASGKARPLLNAPHYGGAHAMWSPDSRSLAMPSAYAPLDVTDENERTFRSGGPFLYEYEVESGKLRHISDERDVRFDLLSWTPDGVLTMRRGRKTEVAYRRDGENWVKCEPKPEALNVRVEQGLNRPPQLWAGDKMVLDLNPGLRQVRLGEVRAIEWNSADGSKQSGGLFLPPAGVAGKPYPLVIQVGEWEPNKFHPGGCSATTVYAAQALANQGMAVVQTKVAMPGDDYVTPREGLRVRSALEGLVDELHSQGLIDRERLGLVGFSRTCFHVKYTLAHSSYPFRAAVISDGVDCGYFQYVVNPQLSGEFEAMNGGDPYSKPAAWLERAPGFQLSKIQAALLIQEPHRETVIGAWEWFTGLRRLDKPVELVVYKDDAHQMLRPSHLLAAQQYTLDWMKFWLQGREDGEPERFARWREMRRLHASTRRT